MSKPIPITQGKCEHQYFRKCDMAVSRNFFSNPCIDAEDYILSYYMHAMICQ